MEGDPCVVRHIAHLLEESYAANQTDAAECVKAEPHLPTVGGVNRFQLGSEIGVIRRR
jgi:hypothetical protein